MTKTRQSPNTRRATKLTVRIFKDYLTEKNIPHPPSPRKNYSMSIKAEKQIEILIQRVPYNIFDVWTDIINDPYFKEVNKVFLTKLTKGLVSNYKYPIQDET